MGSTYLQNLSLNFKRTSIKSKKVGLLKFKTSRWIQNKSLKFLVPKFRTTPQIQSFFSNSNHNICRRSLPGQTSLDLKIRSKDNSMNFKKRSSEEVNLSVTLSISCQMTLSQLKLNNSFSRTPWSLALQYPSSYLQSRGNKGRANRGCSISGSFKPWLVDKEYKTSMTLTIAQTPAWYKSFTRLAPSCLEVYLSTALIAEETLS